MENTVEQTDVSQFEHWFTSWEDATYSSRQEAERARDYVDGNQLTSEEKAALDRRGQPPVVINRVRRKIEWLKGLEVNSRTDPRAFPRTPNHEDGAEAATDAIRFVCDKTDFDTVRSEVADNFYVEGYGACEVVHEEGANGEIEVVINQYPWDRVFGDPHSRKHDFEDARYKGVVLWQDEADFLADYPKHKDHVSTLYGNSVTNTYEDKPDHWSDPRRKRIRVILMWYRKGREWHWVKFIKGAALDGGPSPYQDEKGETVCPLVMATAFVGRNNDRYGLVRDMFDPQDEVNKRRSKALFNVSARQTVGIKGAVDSVTDMKHQLSQADGHIELNSEVFEEAARTGVKPWDVVPNSDQTAGQFELLQEAKNEIDLLGANAALAGEGEKNSSGRAVQAKQQGGLIEIASLNDRLRQLTKEVYRQIWLRVRQFWTEERWIRVTDDERNVRFVGLNQPVTVQDQLSQMPEEQVMQFARENGLYPGHPMLEQVVGVRNNVEEIDVDIILEEVPDTVTLAGETFEQLVNISSSMPGAIPPEILIEAAPNLDRKIKDKLLEKMGEAQQQQAQQGEMVNQVEVATRQAETEKMQSETAKNMATAQKTMVEASQPQIVTAAG